MVTNGTLTYSDVCGDTWAEKKRADAAHCCPRNRMLDAAAQPPIDIDNLVPSAVILSFKEITTYSTGNTVNSALFAGLERF